MRTEDGGLPLRRESTYREEDTDWLTKLGIGAYVWLWVWVPLLVMLIFPGLFRVSLFILAILAGLLAIAGILHLVMRLPAWIGTAIEYVNYKRGR